MKVTHHPLQYAGCVALSVISGKAPSEIGQSDVESVLEEVVDIYVENRKGKTYLNTVLYALFGNSKITNNSTKPEDRKSATLDFYKDFTGEGNCMLCGGAENLILVSRSYIPLMSPDKILNVGFSNSCCQSCAVGVFCIPMVYPYLAGKLLLVASPDFDTTVKFATMHHKDISRKAEMQLPYTKADKADSHVSFSFIRSKQLPSDMGFMANYVDNTMSGTPSVKTVLIRGEIVDFVANLHEGHVALGKKLLGVSSFTWRIVEDTFSVPSAMMRSKFDHLTEWSGIKTFIKDIERIKMNDKQFDEIEEIAGKVVEFCSGNKKRTSSFRNLDKGGYSMKQWFLDNAYDMVDDDIEILSPRKLEALFGSSEGNKLAAYLSHEVIYQQANTLKGKD